MCVFAKERASERARETERETETERYRDRESVCVCVCVCVCAGDRQPAVWIGRHFCHGGPFVSHQTKRHSFAYGSTNFS